MIAVDAMLDVLLGIEQLNLTQVNLPVKFSSLS
jgi:hypothetical protein